MNKMFLKVAVFLISIVFFPTVTFAQNQNDPQLSESSQKKVEQKPRRGNTPQFSDFSAGKIFTGKPAPVDLSSHPIARMFRTRLRKGSSEGPNFAGHYALVWWGCGNECGRLLAVDVCTGKVYGTAGISGTSETVASSRGVDFRVDSRLLIIDSPCPKNDCNPFVSVGLVEEFIDYYVMEKNGLKLIHSEPCKLMNKKTNFRDCD
jgi:hypothetical protein